MCGNHRKTWGWAQTSDGKANFTLESIRKSVKSWLIKVDEKPAAAFSGTNWEAWKVKEEEKEIKERS